MSGYLKQLFSVSFTIWIFPVKLAFRVGFGLIGALGLGGSGKDQISNSRITNKNNPKPLNINANYINDTEMERQYAIQGRNRHQNAGVQEIRTKQDEQKQPPPQKNRQAMPVQNSVSDTSQNQNQLKNNLEEIGKKLEKITTSKIMEEKTLPKPGKEEAKSDKTNNTTGKSWGSLFWGSPKTTATTPRQENLQQAQQTQELENQKDVSDTSQQRDRLVDNPQEKKGGQNLEMDTAIQTLQKTLEGITPPRPEKEKAYPYKNTFINTPFDSPQNTLKRAPKGKQQPQQRQELENQKDVSDTSQQRDLLVDNPQEKQGGGKLEMILKDDPRIAQIAAKYRPAEKGPLLDNKEEKSGPQLHQSTLLKNELASETEKSKESNLSMTSMTVTSAPILETGDRPLQTQAVDLKSVSSPQPETETSPEKPKESNANMASTTVKTAKIVKPDINPPQSPKADIKSDKSPKPKGGILPRRGSKSALRSRGGSGYDSEADTPPQSPKADIKSDTSPKPKGGILPRRDSNLSLRSMRGSGYDSEAESEPKSGGAKSKGWTLPRRVSALANSPSVSRRGSLANSEVEDSEGVFSDDNSPSASPKVKRKAKPKALLKRLSFAKKGNLSP